MTGRARTTRVRRIFGAVRRKPSPRNLLSAALIALAAPSGAAAWCEDAGASMVELKDCLAGVEGDLDREALIAFSAAQRNIAARADHLDAATLARFAAAADRAQAAWRAFVDADCRETVGFEWWGGSGAGVAIRGCVIAATAARVRSLVSRYDLDPADYPLAHRDGG